MIRNLKEYFSFTRRETRALLFVIIILFLSIIYRIWVGIRVPEVLILSDEEKAEIVNFITSFEKNDQIDQGNPAKVIKTEASELRPFNPQTVKINDLKQMGVNDFIAGNIVKYREAGGKFVEAEDLRKIYGVDETLFKRLKPYIVIPVEPKDLISETTDSISSEKTLAKKATIIIEINSAKFRDFMLLEGMDARLAGRIIKYRELTGGFYSLDQLKEVYGMRDSVVNMLAQHIVIDQSQIRKYHLNSVTFKELLQHPYLSKPQVQNIFSLKNYYGDSLSFVHIEKNRILDDSTMARIRPYFEK